MTDPKPSPTRETEPADARRRWGPHGPILRLDELEPVTRSIVVAILDAQENAKKREANIR